MSNYLSGEPDAGEPPVRFGGRGEVSFLAPTPIKSFATSRATGLRASVLDCGSPLPLSHRPSKTLRDGSLLDAAPGDGLTFKPARFRIARSTSFEMPCAWSTSGACHRCRGSPGARARSAARERGCLRD